MSAASRRRWGHNARFSEHWTEADDRVLNYLRNCFGADPEHRQGRADFNVGGAIVEVKSCSEWVKASHANGKRSRGRFQFKGHEVAEYVLFVLVRGNGALDFRLHDCTIDPRIGLEAFKLNWSRLFA